MDTFCDFCNTALTVPEQREGALLSSRKEPDPIFQKSDSDILRLTGHLS
jgi:hypothetical protein